MSLRVSTNTGYLQILRGVNFNQLRLARAQSQASTGKRVLLPSDDPAAMARTILLGQRSSEANRALASIRTGITNVNLGASGLQEASTLLSEGRALVLQGMNATVSLEDRQSIASQIELIREQLLDTANFKVGERYLFAGTRTDTKPFQEATVGGHLKVDYHGDQGSQALRIGAQSEVAGNIPGSEIFAKNEASGLSFGGVTGLAAGQSANQGTGVEHVILRHDATDVSALAAQGIASAQGGADDSFLGSAALVIDAAAGTIRLGSGEAVALPAAGSPGLSDFAVRNELGGELHLDLSSWDGTSVNADVSASGSLSIDGSTWQAIDFNATDAELSNPNTGSVLHVDLTGVKRAAEEEVAFSGAVNLFDALTEIADLLRSPDASGAQLAERVGSMLQEFDRNHENLLNAMGQLGAHSARMSDADDRLQDLDVRIQGMVSERMDADYSQIAIELAQGQLALQAVMATGSRIMQTSLINFLN